MKRNFNYILAVLFFCLIIWAIETFKSEPEIIVEIKRDTLYMKPDTVIQTKIKYVSAKALIETVYVEKQPIQVAKADTTLSDSSRIQISYWFPPLNKFDIIADIKEKIITKEKIIKELKTVTIKEQPVFYKNTWFWVSLVEFTLIIAALLGG